ncbi:bile acid:sodium symporter [Kiritimatiellota bacterium B12222]|nr:bile acid:sodium symporter [Kiritimatiellota bacterium B12222]
MPPMFIHLESLILRHFSLILIAALALGLALPSLANALAPVIMPVLMIVIYLGFLKTDYQILAQEIRNLKRQLWLNCFCLLLIPSLLFGVTKGLEIFAGTHPAWGTGVLLLFACPIATVAPTLALVMHGHFERTLSSLILSTILAPFTLPLLLSFWLGASIDLSFLDMSFFLLKLILIPFVAAQISSRLFPSLHHRLKPHTASLSILLLTLIVIGAVAGLASIVKENPTHILEGIAVASGCMLLAYLIGWFLQPKTASFADRSTLAILATWCNIGLSIVFAKQFFPHSDVLLFVVLAEIPWNMAFAPAHAFVRRQAAKQLA